MIEKQIIAGVITVLEDGQLEVRTDTILLEDGVELIRTYHRGVLEPDSDPSVIVDPRVQSIATTVWTKKVVDDYKKKRKDATGAHSAGAASSPQQS